MSNAITPGHRIAVISDTHNLLRPEVADVVRTCEIVLHGGDISGSETFEKIRNLFSSDAVVNASAADGEKPGSVYVVRGNNDRDWASDIPYTLEIELYGRKFFMTHKKKDIPSDVEADVVIYGHSHRYAQDYIDGTLYLNPGSCGPRRFNQAITMAVLTVPDTDLSDNVLAEGGSGKKSYGIIVERVDIPHAKTASAASTPGVVCPGAKETSGVVCSPNQVTADLIRKIGTDLERHRTVADIAARRNVSRELAEQIVRLYVTHPGVTPEQVMSKMGL